MKKVVAFIGSPKKKGNTSDIVNEVLKGACEAGAEIKTYHLNDMSIKGCQGCMYCRKHEICAVRDDMQQIYEDIKTADAVVIGSPVYICQVSAQTKLLLDRFYPLTDFKHKPRFGAKKVLMVYSHAAPISIFFTRYFAYTEKYLKPMGLKVVNRLVATKCIEPGIASKNKKLMDKAFKFGKALVCD
ncbi:MAG: flavodoxin family protein [Clostridia bacterium]|nr:flavodoxin family protein [Clostridia bacterium]